MLIRHSLQELGTGSASRDQSRDGLWQPAVRVSLALVISRQEYLAYAYAEIATESIPVNVFVLRVCYGSRKKQDRRFSLTFLQGTANRED